MNEPIYEVRTWDTDLDEFTPQLGMDRWYYGFAGLREALRQLQSHGYVGRKGDISARIERVDQPAMASDIMYLRPCVTF